MSMYGRCCERNMIKVFSDKKSICPGYPYWTCPCCGNSTIREPKEMYLRKERKKTDDE